MTKHEEKYCARCSQLFECRAGDIGNCQCSQVQLLQATTEFLLKTSYGCLCAACLRVIDQMIRFSSQHPLPMQKDLLVNGLHYYFENGQWIFTELYHLERGHCCQNNCRHCAYGYAHKGAEKSNPCRTR